MQNEIAIYGFSNNLKSIEVVLNNDTIWLNQVQISALFGTKRPAITKLLKNIFESDKLNEKMVCSILEQTTKHGFGPIVGESFSAPNCQPTLNP
jgi:hypothetical protein